MVRQVMPQDRHACACTLVTASNVPVQIGQRTRVRARMSFFRCCQVRPPHVPYGSTLAIASIKQSRRTGHVPQICAAVAVGCVALSAESQGSKC
jgi:hypothetical protein